MAPAERGDAVVPPIAGEPPGEPLSAVLVPSPLPLVEIPFYTQILFNINIFTT